VVDVPQSDGLSHSPIMPLLLLLLLLDELEAVLLLVDGSPVTPKLN